MVAIVILLLTVVCALGIDTVGAQRSKSKGGPTRATPTLSLPRVEPELGNASTNFTYRVVYGDSDDRAPSTASLHIYLDNGSTPIPGSPFTMQRDADANPRRLRDGNYANGEQYRSDITLAEEHFTYHYKFEFTNTDGTGLTALLEGPIVDTTPVDLSAWSPSMNWVNSTTVTCRITVTDNYEVSGESIHYRTSTISPSELGDWHSAGMTTNAQQLVCTVDETFAVGSTNFIQWAAQDSAGNGWMTSPVINFYVDDSPVTFSAPRPGVTAWNRNRSVACSISVDDTGGSGVDAGSIQYRWKNTEMTEYSAWYTPSCNEENGSFRCTTPPLPFSESAYSNYIYWRATDIANNALVESERYPILVDSAAPSLDRPSPANESWLNTTRPSLSIIVDDAVGSGPNETGVEYSVALNGSDQWRDWQTARPQSDTGGIDSAEATFLATPEFRSGRNRIKWRAWDVAGNGPVHSAVIVYHVDTVAPQFLAHSPPEERWLTTRRIECNITVTDTEDGALAPMAAQIRYSTSLAIEKRNWAPLTAYPYSVQWLDEATRTHARLGVELELVNGTSNQIQWRVADRAGNWNISPIYQIKINTTVAYVPPEVIAVNATPHRLENDGEAVAIVAATVVDDDGADDIVKVLLDLSPLGGLSELALADDGTRPDDIANDGVWTAAITAAPSTTAGTKFLALTVYDQHGHITHGTLSVEIVEYTAPPALEDPLVTPGRLPNIGGGEVRIAVNVSDPDGAEDIVGVFINVSALIGGSEGGAVSHELHDDGATAHGDRVAGDGEYATTVTVNTSVYGVVELTVFALDRRGLQTERTVELVLTDAPRVTLQGPLQGTDDTPLRTMETTLRWATTDHDSDAEELFYAVYLAEERTLVVDRNTSARVVSEHPSTRLNDTLPFDATVYYWCVVPYDENGMGRASTVGRLAVETLQSYLLEVVVHEPDGAEADAIGQIGIDPDGTTTLWATVTNKGDGTDRATLQVDLAPASAAELFAIRVEPSSQQIDRSQSAHFVIAIEALPPNSASNGDGDDTSATYELIVRARSQDRSMSEADTVRVDLRIEPDAEENDGVSTGMIAAISMLVAAGLVALIVVFYLRRRAVGEIGYDRSATTDPDTAGAVDGEGIRSRAGAGEVVAIPDEDVDIYYEPEIKRVSHAGESGSARRTGPRRVKTGKERGPYQPPNGDAAGEMEVEVEVVEAEYFPAGMQGAPEGAPAFDLGRRHYRPPDERERKG